MIGDGDATVRPQAVVARAGVPRPGIGITENSASPMTGNRLGISFYIDINVLDFESRDADALRELDRAGWIDLVRTDTMDTELADTKDEKHRQELLDRSERLPESFGPAVLDHSRFDHSVYGTDADDERINRVYAVLFPGSDRLDTSSGRSRRKLRDAMHIATAMRYNATGFVTRDGTDLLRKAPQIATAFDGFKVLSIAGAVELAEAAKGESTRG